MSSLVQCYCPIVQVCLRGLSTGRRFKCRDRILYVRVNRLRSVRLLRACGIGMRRRMFFLSISFFFFSSRRRHTRLQGDWSSDVCSSDLALEGASVAGMVFSTTVSAVATDLDEDAFEDLCARLVRRQQMVRAAGVQPFPDGRDRKSVV